MLSFDVRCPHCKNKHRLNVTSKQLDEREAAVSSREAELRRLEEALQARECEHQNDVRLIRGCLHPDRHPEDPERYNRAMQAFNRLLEQPVKTSADGFTDDIPF